MNYCRLFSALIPLVLLFSCSLSLIVINTNKIIDQKNNYNNLHQSSVAYVINITTTKRTCWQQHYCNQCIDGSQLPHCDILINQNKTGECHRINGPQCLSNKHEYYFRNQHQIIYDYTNIQKQLCQVINGTCQSSIMYLRYDVENTHIILRRSVNCSLTDNNCIYNFNRNLSQGDMIMVYYTIDNPKNISFDAPDDYKVPDILTVGLVFGIFIFIITFGCLIYVIIYYNDKYWEWKQEQHIQRQLDYEMNNLKLIMDDVNSDQSLSSDDSNDEVFFGVNEDIKSILPHNNNQGRYRTRVIQTHPDGRNTYMFAQHWYNRERINRLFVFNHKP